MKTGRYDSYTRERTRGDYSHLELNQESYTGYPSDRPFVTVGQTGAPFRFSMMWDVVTPDFRLKQAKGIVTFSPMTKIDYQASGSCSKYVVTLSPPYTPTANLGSYYTGIGNTLLRTLLNHKQLGTTLRIGDGVSSNHVGPIRTAFSGAELNSLANEAVSKAASIQGDAQLLVLLGELKSTLALAPDLFRSFAKLLATANRSYSRAYSTGGGRAIARTLGDEAKILNDIWLAIRFGLRPLIADIRGISENLQRQARDFERLRITSRGNASAERSSGSQATLAYGCIMLPISEQTTDSYTVRSMTLWEAQLDRLDRLGVNVANVPLALVDLTAFSFVLNWFVTLNEFASSIGAALQRGWMPLGGCTVQRREATTIYTLNGAYQHPSFPGWVLTTAPAGMWVTTRRDVVRIPGIPKATLALRGDPFRWTRDWRLADAAALLAQQVRGRGVQRLLGNLAR